MRTNLITTGNLIALYNGYLRTDSATGFLQYLASNGYLTSINGTALQFENAVFPAATTDLNYEIDNPTHREKLGELFDFIAEHDESVKDLIGTTTKEEVLQDVEANAFVNSYKLNTYYHEKLFEKYKLGDKNPKLDKMKRKTTWIAKKFVIPTLITAAITTAVGATIALIPALAGTSIFWSGNALVGIRSLGQLGLLSGLIGTPTFILGKDLINWLVYKRYSNENQLETLKKSDVKNVNDINSLNLGIVNLIKNFKEDQEIIDECRKSKNPFKRLNGYIHRKWNRNKLHSLTAFTRDFLKVYNSTVDANDRAKYAAYLEYIENFCNEVYTKDEQQALRNKKRGKTSKRLYADIFVRELIPYLDNEGQSRRKSKAKSIKRAVTARRELAKATLGDETARPIKLIDKQPSGNEPVRRNRTINIPTHTPTPNPDRKLLPSRGIIYLPGEIAKEPTSKKVKDPTSVEYTMSGNGYDIVMQDTPTQQQSNNSTKQPAKTTTPTQPKVSPTQPTNTQPPVKPTKPLIKTKEEEVKSTKTIESDKKVLEFLSGYYDPQRDKFRDDKDIKDNMKLFDETISEMTKGALSPKEVADFRKSIKDAQGKTGKFGESLTWHTAKATRTKLKRKQYELLYKLSKIDEKTGISDTDYYTSEIIKLITEIEQEKALRAQKTQSKTNNI